MKANLFINHFRYLGIVLAGCSGCLAVSAPNQSTGGGLSKAQILRVGQKIWQNECGGTVVGLTSWNTGEAFASLGIGHFIWYPNSQDGPFEESFPQLLAYLDSRGVSSPAWMRKACPWPTKAVFEQDKNGERQIELRKLMSQTVQEQTEFIILRMEGALPKMLAQAKSAVDLRFAFDALKATPEGLFCLIDYVNFKGEGTNPKERYKGLGWGLLQVLEGISKQKTVWHYPGEFAESAKSVLSRRVANSPSSRNEKRWLAGWHNRCDGYRRPL